MMMKNMFPERKSNILNKFNFYISLLFITSENISSCLTFCLIFFEMEIFVLVQKIRYVFMHEENT